MSVGFVGLGVMGGAMARNLLAAGTELVVWNRTSSKAQDLAEQGAVVARDPAQVLASCTTTFLMLADDTVLDEVLGRARGALPALVGGRVLVNTGTVPPSYSSALAADVSRCGGHYVEAPVSGSRGPAEDGTLVAMLAGDGDAVEAVRPLLAPLCARQVVCGPVPYALLTKLAVNIHLITMVAGLAEAFHFAEREGLDLRTVAEVLEAGPMTSRVSRTKSDKLVAADMAPQASASDVLYNCQVILQEARGASIDTPLLEACERLFAQTRALGHGADDMVGVIHALRALGHDRPAGRP